MKIVYCRHHPKILAVLGKTYCQFCLDNKKIESKRLKLEGRCHSHPDRPVVIGKVSCQECLDNKKERYYFLKSKGKCHGHPKIEVVNGKCGCIKCENDHKKFLIKYNNTLKNNKMCISHPNRPVVQGRLKCKECLWDCVLRNNNLSNKQATEILEKQNYICPWTGRLLVKGVNASPDHIIPIGKHRKDKNHPLNELSNIQFVDTEMQYFKIDKSEMNINKLIDDIVKCREKYGRKE